MANIFNRLLSKADFWDKKENASQQAQFDKEDEERRKRQQAAASRQASVGIPGTVVTPTPQPTASSNLGVGSQSDFTPAANLKKAKPSLLDTVDSFSDTAADKIGGGVGRGLLRTADLLLPGKNSLNLEGIADESDKRAKASAASRKDQAAAKTGAKFGSAVKGAADIATVAIPTTKVDKVVEATKAYKALSEGSKISKVGAQLTKVVPGSLAGTGVDALVTKGRGDDVDIAKNAGTGVATDLAVNALPLGLGKVASTLRKGSEEPVEETAKTGYSIFSKLKKLGKNTEANLNEGQNIQTLEREATSATEDVAAVPGRSEDNKNTPSAPSVEVSPGIKSTNLVKAQSTAEPTQVATEQGGTIDRGTDLKVGELMDKTAGVPVADGMKRLYQGTENGVLTDWHFDNVDDLARYFSNRSDNVDFNYRDVPADQAVQQASRGNGVYRVAESNNIPDPTSPVALAKIDDTSVQNELPNPELDQNVADFSRSINGSEPLKKAQALGVQGNPMIQSDVTSLRQAIDNGDMPETNPNLGLEAADQTSISDQVAAEQVDLPADGAAAPRTRARAAGMIRDEDLRKEVLDNFPERQTMNIAETERRTIQDINNMTDDELVTSLPNNVIVDTPEDFLRTVNSIKRLENIDTPEAQNAIANAVNALTDFSARSGRNLRTTQILFDDMPVALKVKTLEKQLNKAGGELDDDQMQILTSLVTRADNATNTLRNLEDEAENLLGGGTINNASLTPETRARATELSSAINEARAAKELRSGEAWKYWQDQMPKGPIGKRVGDVGRTLMLSSPTGRVFDVASTAITAADDTLTHGVSNLIGKALNKFTGPGDVQDTLPNLGAMGQGLKEGAQRTVEAFKGKDHVEDVLSEAKRATRGDVNTGGSKIRQTIRAAVELPTNLTRGLRTDQLYREGMQEAAGLGLKGEARQTYAQLRASIPSQDQLENAVQIHMKANMLHDNSISKALNNVANSLDVKGGGWAAPFIRNQIAPFTSWLGGNLHRTLTDKNVLWNVGSAVNNAFKGNAQGVIDDVAKLAVNTGEAFAAGMLLTRAGVITPTDANGDSYGGLYFHIGDRYIPVAMAGTVSVPLILGNGIQQAYDAGKDGASGQEVVSAFVNSAGLNNLKNAGVSSVFGGDNNLQSSVDTALREGGDLVAGGAQFGGNIVRQYIPSLASDVNAGLDQTNLNPTHEAAETKVTRENPETGRQVNDVFGTEFNKTLNKVPFASQTLDRKPETASKDIVDRITKGNHETGTQAQEKQSSESLKKTKAQLIRDKVPLQSEDIKAAMDDGNYEKARRGLDYQIAEEQAKLDASPSKIKKLQDQRKQADMGERGVPITDDGIKARTEDGDYEQAMEGLGYQLEKAKDNKDTPKSKLQKIQDNIKRLQVTSDKKYKPETITAYNKTSNSAWKAMGDSKSDEYDPDMYNLLAQYDADLAANKVSGSPKDGSKPKYYTSGNGRGGKNTISTDIGTNRVSFDSNFTPIKLQKAGGTSSEIASVPLLQKVRNNDRTKLKKISVSRGA